MEQFISFNMSSALLPVEVERRFSFGLPFSIVFSDFSESLNRLRQRAQFNGIKGLIGIATSVIRQPLQNGTEEAKNSL